MPQLKADRRLWLTRDRQVVEDGDPRAAILLAGKGQYIPATEVERLGLEVRGGRVKQRERPEDKARRPAENKGARKENAQTPEQTEKNAEETKGAEGENEQKADE